MYQFPHSLTSTRSVIPGLWLSYDHDKHIAAGAMLLCDHPLNDNQVLEELRQQFEVGCEGTHILPVIRRRL